MMRRSRRSRDPSSRVVPAVNPNSRALVDRSALALGLLVHAALAATAYAVLLFGMGIVTRIIFYRVKRARQ